MKFLLLGVVCLGVCCWSPTFAVAQLHDHDHVQRGPVYRFGARSHTEQLAKDLWNDVNAVCWEAYNHHKHDPGWKETYREMRSMLDDTRHLGQLVEQNYHHANHADEDHIKKDLHDMDRLMHHIERGIAHWRPHVYDPHDHGVHYYANRGGLNSRVAKLAETLHHLMRDYGVNSNITAPNGAAPQGGNPLAAPQAGVQDFGVPRANTVRPGGPGTSLHNSVPPRGSNPGGF